jgi:integrase
MSEQLQETLRRLFDDRYAKVVALDPVRQAELNVERGAALEDWVFPDANGRHMDPDNFRSRVWEPLLVAAELRHVRIHDLRHTYASLMIEAGKELHYIQQQLGHHSPAFTLSVYGHLLPRDRRGEVNCLDDKAETEGADGVRNDVHESPLVAAGGKKSP